MAERSSCGVRSQITSWFLFLLLLLVVALPTFNMSIGMDVPDTPRNWDKAEVRYVRAVRASRGGWGIVADVEEVDVGGLSLTLRGES